MWWAKSTRPVTQIPAGRLRAHCLWSYHPISSVKTVRFTDQTFLEPILSKLCSQRNTPKWIILPGRPFFLIWTLITHLITIVMSINQNHLLHHVAADQSSGRDSHLFRRLHRGGEAYFVAPCIRLTVCHFGKREFCLHKLFVCIEETYSAELTLRCLEKLINTMFTGAWLFGSVDDWIGL